MYDYKQTNLNIEIFPMLEFNPKQKARHVVSLCTKLGMVELCAKNLQIMRNDFTDYARTFCQLCANYAHFLPIMRKLCAMILKIMHALCQLCAPST